MLDRRVALKSALWSMSAVTLGLSRASRTLAGQRADVKTEAMLDEMRTQFEALKPKFTKDGVAVKRNSDLSLAQASSRGDDVYIYSASYSSPARPGSQQSVGLTFYSYQERETVALSCFVGLGQFLKEIGLALAARDQAWPLLSTDLVYLQPKKMVYKEFTFTVPQSAIPNVYWANLFLWGPISYKEDKFYGRMYVPITVIP